MFYVILNYDDDTDTNAKSWCRINSGRPSYWLTYRSDVFTVLGTGIVVDKMGRTFMVIASGVTLALAGIMAALATGHSIFWLAFALILLGLGWNFGLISGTAIIIDSTDMKTRAKTQGSVECGLLWLGQWAAYCQV